MSEAPERIWVARNKNLKLVVNFSQHGLPGEVEYVRADLYEELADKCRQPLQEIASRDEYITALEQERKALYDSLAILSGNPPAAEQGEP